MTYAPSPTLTLDPNASPLRRLWIGVRCLVLLQKDKTNPDYARLLHLSFDREAYARLAERMHEVPEWHRILEERRTLPGDGWTLERLSNLPEGTLGHAWARFYADNGIAPLPPYAVPLNDDVEFLLKRYREAHDIHHIVTGYGTEPAGELEVQAFYYGNLGLPHSKFLIWTTWWVPQLRLSPLAFARRMRAAYKRGKASSMILGVPFDEMWEQPVSEIAERLIAPPN